MPPLSSLLSLLPLLPLGLGLDGLDLEVRHPRHVRVPHQRDDVRRAHLQVHGYEPKVQKLKRHPNLPVGNHRLRPVLLQLGHHRGRVAFDGEQRGDEHREERRREDQLVQRQTHRRRRGADGARGEYNLVEVGVPEMEARADERGAEEGEDPGALPVASLVRGVLEHELREEVAGGVEDAGCHALGQHGVLLEGREVEDPEPPTAAAGGG
mmetsp:Transcript_9666/g.43994  ORF Transcript_9666/g.43994 Transcript_9666/m.43994 type:complete len:210 (-) Transcript_9666:465-1094(-)